MRACSRWEGIDRAARAQRGVDSVSRPKCSRNSTSQQQPDRRGRTSTTRSWDSRLCCRARAARASAGRSPRLPSPARIVRLRWFRSRRFQPHPLHRHRPGSHRAKQQYQRHLIRSLALPRPRRSPPHRLRHSVLLCHLVECPSRPPHFRLRSLRQPRFTRARHCPSALAVKGTG